MLGGANAGRSVTEDYGDAIVEWRPEAYNAEQPNYALNGPELALAPKAALSLSLAVHEFATNAAKYGALSVASGRIQLSWTFDADKGVELMWPEKGGPTVSTPKRRGFGSTLIERALAMETGGTSKWAMSMTA
jgi:two-component system, chemotaxis family, sensor kinase Cph1